ncbi:DUF4288 domain-containing protein [Ferruginibacter sp. HRS2-29]|uniref:DUF4288 domain-containing protein n=1 Tax=Ferruginibacter sp. HRS2-29 TaxID=2487334 RepID=UPI0020CF488A|nr:DUF4288 domain-containing protein [Ferruginibacter sp. HRS2-29]MCP9749801.1 DUF4288 domain-containing protein [Ferruginibacter sp. HRS2-29]
MKWYLAKIVFRIICGDGDHKAQFDEQVRLVLAENADEAFEKAHQIGEDEQDSFMNHIEQLVQWKFINVSELYQLHDMIHGAEVFSRIEEHEDGENYTNIVHNKARHTRERNALMLFEQV